MLRKFRPSIRETLFTYSFEGDEAMRFAFGCITLVVVGLVFCGCNGPTASTGEVPGDQVEQAAGPKTETVNLSAGHLPRDAKADDVLKTFLNLLQTGEVNRSVELLTRTARQKTADEELAMRPINGGDMDFQVGSVKTLTDDTAHINSVWMTQGGSFGIVWVMRMTDEGWRVAGMSTRHPETDALVFFNFEDPKDMLAKSELSSDNL